MTSPQNSVLVLGGGPDAERQISITSATAVHQGCLDAGLDAKLLIIDQPATEEIASWKADVIFPVLHGKFGEGGQLQYRLQEAGCVFVGSKAQSSRIAMDKLATKLIAAQLNIPTTQSALLDPEDLKNPGQAVCPIAPPLVIKPVADGSSCGLYICQDHASWIKALSTIAQSTAPPISMIEPQIIGRELTISVLDDGTGILNHLPIIEIVPKSGIYDYQAKYDRNDTIYTLSPDLADDLVSNLQHWSLSLCRAIGVRHLGRVDFMLDESGYPWLLEINTMPGFTPTSLLPKAAAAAGLPMPELCKHLVNAAIGQHAAPSQGSV